MQFGAKHKACLKFTYKPSITKISFYFSYGLHTYVPLQKLDIDKFYADICARTGAQANIGLISIKQSFVVGSKFKINFGTRFSLNANSCNLNRSILFGALQGDLHPAIASIFDFDVFVNVKYNPIKSICISEEFATNITEIVTAKCWGCCFAYNNILLNKISLTYSRKNFDLYFKYITQIFRDQISNLPRRPIKAGHLFMIGINFRGKFVKRYGNDERGFSRILSSRINFRINMPVIDKIQHTYAGIKEACFYGSKALSAKPIEGNLRCYPKNHKEFNDKAYWYYGCGNVYYDCGYDIDIDEESDCSTKETNLKSIMKNSSYYFRLRYGQDIIDYSIHNGKGNRVIANLDCSKADGTYTYLSFKADNTKTTE